jgi:hypothetical protein
MTHWEAGKKDLGYFKIEFIKVRNNTIDYSTQF